MKFDDINLNDDKSAPKLGDLDFGLGATSDKKSGGGFSFGGGWGGGWGSTGASWGFGSVEDDKKEKIVEDSSWNFTSTKKDKDKKKSNAFDFDFDNLAGDDFDLGAPAKADEKEKQKEKPVEDDPW